MYIEHVFVVFMISLTVQCLDYGLPKGVAPSASAFYDPAKDFACFDGSYKIPFNHVNDNYCDCEDGSDEPGTPACPNGWFHCINSGYIETQIPSSRVNDGICDCCDGSDEYGTSSSCINSCSVLNEAARVRAEARAKILSEGNDMRLQLIHLAKQMRFQKEERLKKLEEEKVEAERVKEAAEQTKNLVEEAEAAALKVYRDQEDAARQAKVQAEREEAWKEAHDVFVNLDSNQNNLLNVEEIKVKQIFDRNKDGQVADDEIMWFLDLKTSEVTEEVFHNSIWPQIKPFYMMEKGLFLPPEPQQGEGTEQNLDSVTQLEGQGEIEPHAEEEEEEGPTTGEEDEHLGEEEEEENHQPDEGVGEVIPDSTPEQNYDPHTLRLIEEAKEARAQFESTQQFLQNIEREINEIKEKLDMDYGPEDEYAPLESQCFPYVDREYTYNLCPFNHVTQTSKSGGSETRLGSWSGWSTAGEGPIMIYDKGQSCWNGPQRSTKVFVECGATSALVNVIEPNKCEYQMQFKTPAACKLVDDSQPSSHDEL